MNSEEIIEKIKLLENPKNVKGMERFGIRPKTKVYGVPVPELRKMAKFVKKDHKLALKLWNYKIHEARLLAGMIADPKELEVFQIDKWVNDFDSWDVCDQACMNLFNRSKIAKNQIKKFAKSEKEFVKRTAFALIAALAVHDKEMTDKDFIAFFPLIEEAAVDERNFVKKAVNWALRQIGKRNKKLNAEAINLAEKIKNNPKNNYSKSAKWVANSVIAELTKQEIKSRF
jgi:3-methyladenine DNA glycosylase AlkD